MPPEPDRPAARLADASIHALIQRSTHREAAASVALDRDPEAETIDVGPVTVGPSIHDLIERSSLGTPDAVAARASVPIEQARAIVARAAELADTPDQCPRCDGCGHIADTAAGEPWTAWAMLPPGSDLAVRADTVRPIPCPDCATTHQEA